MWMYAKSLYQIHNDVEQQTENAEQYNGGIHACVLGHDPIVHDRISQSMGCSIGLADKQHRERNTSVMRSEEKYVAVLQAR